ncbi:MAG: type II toxin-antitoxin system Phd/YefM family antitoxin [Thiohalomonadales bacterium]
MAKQWQLQQAKSQFSKLVDDAIKIEPQIVTRHGSKAVVVISYENYCALLKPEKDLVTFMRSSPLVGLELDLARDKRYPRDISF